MAKKSDKLTQLLSLGKAYRKIVQRKKELETELDTLKQKEKDITEKLLPALMIELGLTELKLAGGGKISMKDFCYGKFPEDEDPRAECIKFFRAQGAENLIKNTIVIDKGADDIVSRLSEELQDLGVSFVRKEQIHPQTLLKFIKENKDAENFPREAFGLVEGSKVEFTTT